MDSGAAESSNPWNNAGTGHAGLCELNYTPQAADGSIDIKKAVHINTQFEVSKQFWAYLTQKGTFGSSKSFITPVPAPELRAGATKAWHSSENALKPSVSTTHFRICAIPKTATIWLRGCH